MVKEIRRVVAGHDASGKAVILRDGAAANVRVREGGSGSTMLWVTDETPAILDIEGDPGGRTVKVPPAINGSIFRVVEFAPDKDMPTDADPAAHRAAMGVSLGGDDPARHPGMHRTESIDYAIIMSGEIDMLVDEDEVHLKAGDVVVQLGNNHAWANRGDAPCQVAFILIGAQVDWA